MRKLRNRLLALALAAVLGAGSVSFGVSAEEITDDTVTEVSTEFSTEEAGYAETGNLDAETMNSSAEEENVSEETAPAEEEDVVTEEISAEAETSMLELNEANFPDEVFRSCLATDYDDDGDGWIDANLVEEINVNQFRRGGGIYSLKGVELFPNLEILWAEDNKLTSLDISKNQKLKELYVEGNKLTSIDVSKNTALKTLSCGYNAIEALDVSNNANLVYLYCISDNLTGLDVSNNKNLEYLACSYNKLTTLDVSQNLNLETLVCTNNQLDRLDVSKNTGLKYLDCFWNNLTTLDVSQNTKLTYLDCVDNYLSYVDISNCPFLESGVDEHGEKATYNFSPQKAEPSDITVSYKTHIQSKGWEKDWLTNGATSGTVGSAKRLEAIDIKVSGDYNLGIQYTTHCQSYGWLPWSSDGGMSGTEGEAKRLEAIKIQLTGADKDLYDVYYRVHAQSYGWLNWAKNGEPAGTAGYAKRLEAIQIVVVKKGESIDVNMGGVASKQASAYISNSGASSEVSGSDTTNVAYRTHVQSYGWQGWKYNGKMSGTSGEAKRLEGIKIQLTNKQYSGGIKYRTHVQTYGWEKEWRSDGAMSGTSGEAKRLEAIQIELTGEMAEHYDVYYRVHAQSYGWLGWAKNGESAGTAGYAKRLEGIQIVLVPKGESAPAASYGGVNSSQTTAYVEKITTASSSTVTDTSMVWITATGSKYHSTSTCSNMKNPSNVSLSTAKDKGYTACSKCY